MEEYMNLDEAARLLSVHKTTLLRAIAAGKLEAIRLSKGYRVTKIALQKYIDSLTVNAGVKNK